MEIRRNKTKELETLQRAMELGGHKKGVLSISFNQFNNVAVTLAKDRTIWIWNLNVQWKLEENPKLIKSFTLAEWLSDVHLIAVRSFDEENSQKNMIIACAQSNILAFMNFENGQVDIADLINDAHQDTIVKMQFIGDYLVTLGSEGRINIWKF